MRQLLSIVSLSLLVAPAFAQNDFGVLRNVSVTFTSRGGAAAANNNPSVQFCRYDLDRYAGWGVNPTNTGNREITGFHYLIQDQDLATVDPFSLVAYAEDTNNIGYPDVANPILTTGTIMLPVGTGAGAYNVHTTFTTPLSIPVGADFYLGVEQTTPWATGAIDGCSIWATTGNGAAAETDLPGPAVPPASPDNTFGGWCSAAVVTLAYSTPRQFHIEPIIATASGVASALHYADALHTLSNTSPGTSCMFSSQFPDVAGLNFGRADDLGMNFVMAGIPDNSLVFWLAEIGSTFNATEMPVAQFLPGSTGVLCLNLGSYVTLGFSFTLGGLADHVTVFPAASRTALLGLQIIQQAAALDTTTFLAHAGPCSLSAF